jgi:hypothetical protein
MRDRSPRDVYFFRDTAMKTAEQERRALEQREANEIALAAGAPLPYPNPWERIIARPAPNATLAERADWYCELADRCAPKHLR